MTLDRSLVLERAILARPLGKSTNTTTAVTRTGMNIGTATKRTGDGTIVEFRSVVDAVVPP